MKNLFFTVSLALITVISFGQKTDKDKEKLVAACDKFMQTFTEERYSDAIQMLKQFSIIEPAKVDSLTSTVVNQMTAIADVYGKINSYHFIEEKTIKDFLARRVYIVRFERYYIRFNFILYKSSSGWAVTSFIYSEQVDDLF